MALTFKDVLASEAENALLNTNEFAESVVHVHPESGTSTISAVVDYDYFDIGQPTDEHGTAVKQRAIIEILSSVTVAEERPGGKYPSIFEIGDDVWITKKIVSKDSATQSVEIHRTDKKATKRV